MSKDGVTVNVMNLEKLMKALKDFSPSARVGILGDKDARSKDNAKGTTSNATVGAAHEFGTANLPMRSFLRVPISTKLNSALEQNGAFDKDVLNQVIKQGSIVPWLEKVAISAVAIVLEGFDTGGFGKWPALKASTLAKKTNQQILVESQQLRDSITYEVKGK